MATKNFVKFFNELRITDYHQSEKKCCLGEMDHNYQKEELMYLYGFATTSAATIILWKKVPKR
jgi:hypothetical protein